MDFNLTDEQQMLRDALRRFAQEQYTFEARRRLIESGSGCSKEHWKSFAELGWLALGLPEDIGG
jgi:alkylation response protein AidB-like acyl-CoA dehydrogenase